MKEYFSLEKQEISITSLKIIRQYKPVQYKTLSKIVILYSSSTLLCDRLTQTNDTANTYSKEKKAPKLVWQIL